MANDVAVGPVAGAALDDWLANPRHGRTWLAPLTVAAWHAPMLALPTPAILGAAAASPVTPIGLSVISAGIALFSCCR